MDDFDTYENTMLKIKALQYQYAKPQRENVETRGAVYKIDSEWRTGYTAKIEKNYFPDNELEFLKDLRNDLAQLLEQLDKSIESKTKKREKRK